MMPNTVAIQLRSAKPSVIIRLAKWFITKQTAIFPQSADEVAGFLTDRELPLDAPVPASFERKFQVEHWQAAGQKIVTLHPKSGPGEWHMLYFHGGGFVLPLAKEHWPMLGAMVERFRMSISVPMYDLVPESTYSAQDAVADEAFAKLASEHDPAKIILNGDSAGGHMALSLAMRQAANGGPKPGKLALFAPWLDATMQDEAMQAVEPHDIMLKIGAVATLGKLWAGDRDPKGPECSPLYASDEALSQLPPTRIWTGQHDLFIIDSRSFTMKLCNAGVDAKLYEYAGAPHVFMLVTPSRESKDTLDLFGAFLAE
ncbi:MAG: alpha/beta hydrolase [Erythrobacter sp.]